jgi:hypothetical protein
MATKQSIDPERLDRPLKASGERTIVRREQKELLELIGQFEWDQSFDYKAERNRG